MATTTTQSRRSKLLGRATRRRLHLYSPKAPAAFALPATVTPTYDGDGERPTTLDRKRLRSLIEGPAYDASSIIPASMPMPLRHSHDGRAAYEYAGESEIALGHHLFVCRAAEGCKVSMVTPCMARQTRGERGCTTCEAFETPSDTSESIEEVA